MNFFFSERIASLKPSAIREILKAASVPGVISFSAGNPSAEAFPVDAIRELSDKVLRDNPVLALQYSITEGYTPLRDKVKAFAKERYGAVSDTDDLIIVSGAQQGVDLMTTVTCNEGDTIIAEDPSFIGSLNAFRANSVNIKGVPLLPDGMDMEALEKALQSEKNVRFIYVIPNFQNPTGYTMSLEKRKKLLELATKYDVLILEDNPYGDLRFKGEAIPNIKSFDTEGRVVYLGSFSKIMAPALRLGYVSAHKDLIPKMTVAKQTVDVHTSMWSQLMCDGFLADYDVAAHIAKIQQIYKHKCELMLDSMDKHLDKSKVTWLQPEGGLFIWCTITNGSDMLTFCKTAADNKVAIVPGSAFVCDTNDSSDSFRLNFSTPTDDEIVQGIEKLGALVAQL